MNILVCVKQVPEDEDMRLDPVTKTLVRSQGGRISEYDKYALEAALRLKEELGGKVTAITMGPPQSEAVLRYCLSVGADDVYLLSDRKMGGADAYATASTLGAAKEYLEKSGEAFDLVLCGKQAGDSDTSLVMPELAELLDYPQVTFAKNIFGYDAAENTISIERETDDGTDTLSVKLPAVVSVGRTVFDARYPIIRLKLAANRRKITALDADALGADAAELGVPGSKTTVGASYIPERSKAGVHISGKNDGDTAELLISALLDARKI